MVTVTSLMNSCRAALAQSFVITPFSLRASVLAIKQLSSRTFATAPDFPIIRDSSSLASGKLRLPCKLEEMGEVKKEIIEALTDIIKKSFVIHPFSLNVTSQNAKQVLGHYFAMSQAFPYIQAGAYKDLILDVIEKNSGISKATEETFVVGAFLSFDEVGGNYLLRTKGISALPQLLDTQIHFHASLLKIDMKMIFGEEVAPNYGGHTGIYLKKLLESLGSKDPVLRCAAMVAFEMHAGQMLESLWKALSNAYPGINKESLGYFRLHVGGDDPQEEYHKILTKKMTSSLIPNEYQDEFLKKFAGCYSLSFDWCRNISV